MSTEEDSKIQSYDVELENGIFQMVVTLCQHKAATMSIEQAKIEVAEMLESLRSGLLNN